jgi:YVTN family beta-propeller protein
MSRTPRLVRRATIAGALGVAAAALALPSSPADAVGVGSYAFATQLSFSDPSSLAIVNAADGSVAATVQVGNGAFSTAVSADGQRAYVANYDDGTVSVVDAGQEKVVDTVALPAGSGPNDVALSPDGSGSTSPTTT